MAVTPNDLLKDRIILETVNVANWLEGRIDHLLHEKQREYKLCDSKCAFVFRNDDIFPINKIRRETWEASVQEVSKRYAAAGWDIEFGQYFLTLSFPR